MLSLIRRVPLNTVSSTFRQFSVSSVYNKTYSCQLLVVGGGAGGCTIASKFARRLRKDAVIVLEPSDVHYYQPMFTLVGAGIKKVSDCRELEQSVLPIDAKWLRDSAACISAKDMFVKTASGDVINYEYLVVAVGVNNDYHKVPGLQEALEDPDSGVSTIYSPKYCEKTWSDLKNFRGGDAIFTYPDSVIKCAGAPQKIAYLAESYFRKSKVRSKSNVIYNTSLPVIFGVKKYADALLKVVEKKKMKVNFKTILKSIKHEKKEAVFSRDNKESTVNFDLLHVAPPMSTPEFLRSSVDLVDQCGYLDVDKYTLQHNKYPNIYGIGDCTSTPNAKTAAAVAKQCYVLEMNLVNTMKRQSAAARYNGYGACPLVTDYHKCIIAEFLYDGVPCETMPYDQARESTIAFYMKKDLFPLLYWNFMLKGHYHGPDFIRKIINPFGK